MLKYPKAIEDLIESFSKLPSIGKKSAERFALHIYSKMNDEDKKSFVASLENISNVKICKSCGNVSEADLCNVCNDSSRNHKQVMVIEHIKDLFIIENVNEYQGIYHVLNGAISFSKGIGIEDLNINSLVEKVKQNEVEEIILATNATLEGETTSRYIKELLNSYSVKITRIAHGLPVGGDLSYADELTVLKAVEGRREY